MELPPSSSWKGHLNTLALLTARYMWAITAKTHTHTHTYTHTHTHTHTHTRSLNHTLTQSHNCIETPKQTRVLSLSPCLSPSPFFSLFPPPSCDRAQGGDSTEPLIDSLSFSLSLSPSLSLSLSISLPLSLSLSPSLSPPPLSLYLSLP